MTREIAAFVYLMIAVCYLCGYGILTQCTFGEALFAGILWPVDVACHIARGAVLWSQR